MQGKPVTVKHDWRARSADQPPSPARRWSQRLGLTVIAALLVAIFVWMLLWDQGLVPRVATLQISQYDTPFVPVPFTSNNLELLQRVARGQLADLEDLQTSKSMENPGIRNRLPKTTSDDVLLFYLAGHGISNSGKPYLLCSDFLRPSDSPKTTDAEQDSPHSPGRYEVAKILEQLRDCPAKLKLVVLDVGHIPADPRLGMVVNEFPKLLAEEVKGITHDPSLWILTAEKSLEVSRVSYGQGRSVFAHYVVEGLKGAADEPGNGGNKNRTVELDELYRFVRKNVSRWVLEESGRLVSQTPQLLRAGQGIVTDPEPLPIAEVIRDRKAREEEQEAEEQPAQASKSEQGTEVGSEGEKNRDATAPPEKTVARSDSANPESKPTEPKPAEKPAETSGALSSTSGSAQPSNAPAPEATATTADATGAKASGSGTPAGTVAPAPAPAAQGEKSTEKPSAADRPASTDAEEDPSVAGGPSSRKVRNLLGEAWQLRDTLANRDPRSGGWSPVDYAPHLWREYQEFLLGHELRYRYGQCEVDKLKELCPSADKSVSGSESVLAQLDRARTGFLLSKESRSLNDLPENQRVIKEAIQLMNDVLYAVPDYVRYHRQASRVALGEHPICAPLKELMAHGLPALVKQVESLQTIELTAEPSADISVKFQDLQKQIQSLRQKRKAVEDVLEQEVRSLLERLAEAGAKPGEPGLSLGIENLLATPLLNAERRLRLLDALERVKQPELEPLAGPAGPASEGNTLLPAGGPWNRLYEQAVLEMAAVRLADSSCSLEFSEPPGGLPEAQLWERYRVLGRELEKFYQELPRRIKGASQAKTSAELVVPTRLLRFVDARDVRTLNLRDTEHLAVQAIDSEKLPDRSLQLVGPPDTVPLSRDGWTPLVIKVSTPGRAATEAAVQWKCPELKLAQAGHEEELPAEGASLPLEEGGELRLQVRPRDLEKPFATTLSMKITVGGTDGQQEIAVRLPPPDVVDLLVKRNAPEGDDLPTESGQVIACPVFPNRKTQYRLSLLNRSEREKTVNVQLFALMDEAGAPSKRYENPLDSSGELRPGYRRVRGPVEVKLSSGQELPLPLEAPQAAPPAEKPADAPASPAPASAPAPPAAEPLAPRLICLITDKEKQQPTLKFLEFQLIAPSKYVKPKVQYKANQRKIQITLKLNDDGVRPIVSAENPILVEWENVDVLPQDSRMDPQGELKGMDDTTELFAVVEQSTGAPIRVKLKIDGYPRALVYDVACDSDRENPELVSDLREVHIDPLSPNVFAGSSKEPIKVRFRVDAPRTAFVHPDDTVDLTVEAEGISKPQRRFHADRQMTLSLEKATSQGVLEVGTQVADFSVDLDPGGLRNLKAQIRVSLRLHGEDDPTSDSVEVVLDDSPPNIHEIRLPDHIAKGKELKVDVDATDELSKVGLVQVGFDLNNSGRFDEKETFDTLPQPSADNGLWRFVLKTDDLAPGQTKQILVCAKDQVGNATWAQREVTIDEKPSSDTADKPPSTIKGRLNSADGRTDSRSWLTTSVTIKELGRTEPVDKIYGTFQFAEVPQGKYTLEAKGRRGNSTTDLTGTASLTLGPEPAEVVIPMHPAPAAPTPAAPAGGR